MANSKKKTAEAKATAIIKFNKEVNGIELIIPDGRHLSSDELEILRSLGFCWHRKKLLWYTRYTDEKYELIKASFLGKESQFPAKTEQKVMKEIAAQYWEEQKAKKAAAPKRTSANAQVAALSEKVDKLVDAQAQMMQAMAALMAGK